MVIIVMVHRILYFINKQRKGKKPRDIKLNFDWQNSQLKAQSNAEKTTLNLAPRIVDPLSLHLLVMADLKQGRNAREYTLAKETELKTYAITHEGKERLETPLGQLDTWRVSRHRPGSSRTTILWFAPSLNYLPVQITQKKKRQRKPAHDDRACQRYPSETIGYGSQLV